MATIEVEELRKNMGGTTTMYSIESRPHRDKGGRKTGEIETVIVEHRFPWDRNSKYSAPKFQRMLARGFTFERPTLHVPIERKEETTPGEEVPLYVSDRDKRIVAGGITETPKAARNRSGKTNK